MRTALELLLELGHVVGRHSPKEIDVVVRVELCHVRRGGTRGTLHEKSAENISTSTTS